MGIFQILGGIVLIIASIIIIVTVTMQDTKGGIGATFSGASSTSFFDKNRSRTKEAGLVRATSISGAVLFIVTLAVLFVK